jgi:hypothetical protein
MRAAGSLVDYGDGADSISFRVVRAASSVKQLGNLDRRHELYGQPGPPPGMSRLPVADREAERKSRDF